MGAALLLTGTAVPAAGAPSVQPGTYTASDSDENRPSLRVTSDGKVADFTITVFPSCVDDSGVTATLSRPIAIEDDGTFETTASHSITAGGGEQVVAISKISGEIRADGVAEGQYEFELRDYACSAMAYFYVRNEATTDREPPQPAGSVTVRLGTYTTASGARLTVSTDRRVTAFTHYYTWFCGLTYAGQRLGSLHDPVQISADGSFSTRIPDPAGGTETLRGQFHHDGSVWGSIDYVNSASLCAGSAGFTMHRPTGGATFYLNNGWGPNADQQFHYGFSSDEVFIGDWDGDGKDTIALRRGNTFYLSDRTRGGVDRVFTYGRAGDTILVRDWDADGKDTFAVRRGDAYHVKNSLTAGAADQVIRYGRASDQRLVGDWDGDSRDTFAVRRGKQYFVKNRIAGGNADAEFFYGRATDVTLVGDWDGNRSDTFAVRRGKQYFVKNSIAPGNADLVRNYGKTNDDVYVGDWDGDGEDTLGVRRTS